MRYRKGLWLTGILVVMIIASLSYTLLHHEDEVSTIAYSDGHYTIMAKANDTIKLDSNNLVSHVHKEEILTKTMKLPKNTPLQLKFGYSDQNYTITVTTETKQPFSQTTTIPTTKTYNAYIPYDEIENGKIGLFIGTDDQTDLDTIQNDPYDLKKLKDKQAVLLEQSILFKD